jgi:hypothetical protein
MVKDYKQLYALQLEQYTNGARQAPGLFGNLSLQSQARLNRLSLAEGYIAVWWDSDSQQELLSQSFTPIHVGKHTDRSYPATAVGEAVRRIHETLDRKGLPAFPSISAEEREANAWLSLQCALAQKLGGTERVRPLAFRESHRLLKLHNLTKGAGKVEINTGVR